MVEPHQYPFSFDFGLTLLLIAFHLFSHFVLSANAYPLTFPPGSLFCVFLPFTYFQLASLACGPLHHPTSAQLSASSISQLLTLSHTLSLSLSLFLFVSTYFLSHNWIRNSLKNPSFYAKKSDTKTFRSRYSNLLHHSVSPTSFFTHSLFPLQHLSTRPTQQSPPLPPRLSLSSPTATNYYNNVLTLRSPPPKTSLPHRTSENSRWKSFHPARIRTRCTVVSRSTWSCPVGVSRPL